MSAVKNIVVAGLASFAILASLVALAQEDAGFDSLLKDISTPPGETSAPPKAVKTQEQPAAVEKAQEAPAPVPEAPAKEPGGAEPMPLVPEPATETITPEPAEVTPEQGEKPAPAVEVMPAEVTPAAEVLPAPEEVKPVEAPEPAAEVVTEPMPAVVEEPAAAAVTEPIPAPEAKPEEKAATAQEAEPAAAAAEGEAKPELTPEQAKVLAQQELVRLQAKEKEAQNRLALGLSALDKGDYDVAIRELERAVRELPSREANEAAREQARIALGDAHYRKAAQNLKNGEVEQARTSIDAALKVVPDYRKAQLLARQIANEEERRAKLAGQRIPIKNRSDQVEKRKTIAELMQEGKEYFNVRDWDGAEATFDKILLQDEYNLDAMRFLRRIDEERYKARTIENEASRAKAMAQVRDSWNPPIREELVRPVAPIGPTTVGTKTASQKLQERMQRIVFPSIEFRQANIVDVVTLLATESVKLDPEGNGVNILLNLNIPGTGPAPAAAAPAPAPEEAGLFAPFGELGAAEQPAAGPGGGEAAPAAASGIPAISLNMRRVSLMDAIKYITEMAGLKFRLEDNAVIITPEGVVSGRVETRLYPVQPSFLDVVIEREQEQEQQRGSGEFIEMGGAGRGVMKKADVKEFFIRTGVPFPVGTSITYNPSISQLIVANTPENLEIFERILNRLNVVPYQVEIEARFVEINQRDLEELGFQWILTDDYILAQKTSGSAPLGGTERVQMNGDAQGVTKALRFFEESESGAILPNSTAGGLLAPLGNIASFSSVLTSPEVTLVIQAISQHGGADLLSAPKVTTRSGQNAEIQVVREIIYPTEFDTETFGGTIQPFGGGGNAAFIGLEQPFLVVPGSFETRETGVILNVTPTVGPDGYTIDLTLAPEVSELVEWIQYGVPPYNIPQPIFASRNVTTSLVIWDGQTVVMGGLIREELVRVKDKVPFLGDIPFVGRLFRSEGENSLKVNLLIFVTARLVDPSGKPLNRGQAATGGTEMPKPPAAESGTPAP
jgi:general secretion pathway protein D